VTRAHVRAAAAANSESEELTLARLARYAVLLGIAVPDSGSTARGTTAPPSTQQSRLRLVVVESNGTRVVELSQRITTVGRAAGSDLRLEDNLVLRNHARLVRRNDGSVLVMDAGSTNGTYLDGVQNDPRGHPGRRAEAR
jgi:pSer/pThr/pTyr-binding forkhead associated (FHA) protein